MQMQLGRFDYCNSKILLLGSVCIKSYSNSSIYPSVLNTENHCVSSVAENTRAKSDVFAAENNLPNFQYVLHPRTTGFTFIVDKLRKGDPEPPFQAHCIQNALSMQISQRSIHIFGLLRRSEGVVCVCVRLIGHPGA